jgi:tetratricopeptide (TPR) repeat protein/predicted Ser/Thr protein kinase
MVQGSTTPDIDAPAPPLTPGVVSMRDRVSRRLFGIGTPQQLGRYVIERRLGAGGMGVVYTAFDAELSRQVAIKLVRTDQESEREQQRLREEARALAQLSHPNVVQVHEVGVHDGQLYLVMEYIEGQTLEVWSRDRSPREILRRCIQAGQGLAAAHDAGILHRDVKPNNIVVGDDGRVRVVDFGLARPIGALQSTTAGALADTPESGQTSRLVGTPAYLAPELYNRAPASPHSDQFSFCVMAWQVLSGARPFDAEQLIVAAENGQLRPSGTVRPRWVRRVLERGLAFEPGARWASMHALLEELDSRPRRWAVMTTFVGVALGAGLLASDPLGTSAPTCPDPRPIYDEVWTPTRRAALAEILSARPGGAADFAQLERSVETHRRNWIAAHQLSCTATRIEHAQTEIQLELASACLERERVRLDGLLELVSSQASDELDTRQLLLELGDPRRCIDASALAERVAAPPQLAERVAKLHEHLDEVALLRRAQPRRASIESQALVGEARELGFDPLLAEALALDGKVAAMVLDHPRAQARLREAAQLAKAIGDARLEFGCLREFVALTSEQLADPERSADLLALMLGNFEQLGRPSDLLAETLVAQSELARLRGELDAAESFLRRAIEQRRLDLDESDLRVEQLEIDLANVVADQGRLGTAITLYEQLLDQLRRKLGPRHPEIATVQTALAITLVEAGEPGQARAPIEQALDIRREVYGPASAKLAPLLIVLAQVETAEGQFDAALAATREAWPLERRLARDDSDRGNSLRIEGALLTALERYQEALDVHLLLEREVERLDARDRLALEQSIGWLLCRVDRCAEARTRFEAVLRGDEREFGLLAQIGLVEVELATGEPERACVRLESTIVQLEQQPSFALRPEVLAEARQLSSSRCFAASRPRH